MVTPEQTTKQPSDPNASLLLTSEKAAFCNELSSFNNKSPDVMTGDQSPRDAKINFRQATKLPNLCILRVVLFSGHLFELFKVCQVNS